MFPLCYICFTKIVQFEKRNSGDVQLIFIFTYKYSEKRAEEKWPRFFILNHIVKRDGCFFNSRLVYNNRKENAFIRSPVYLTREYRLISCRIPKSCREGSETTYIELRILMFEE